MEDKIFKKFEKGQSVYLDIDLASGSIVKVQSQSPRGMFTTVTSNDGKDQWEVMSYRLTEIEHRYPKRKSAQ